jgi:hypothetical protein
VHNSPEFAKSFIPRGFSDSASVQDAVDYIEQKSAALGPSWWTTWAKTS